MKHSAILLAVLVTATAPLFAQTPGGFAADGDQMVYIASGPGIEIDLEGCQELVTVQLWTGRALVDWANSKMGGWNRGSMIIELHSGDPPASSKHEIWSLPWTSHPEGLISREFFSDPAQLGYATPWLQLRSTDGAKGVDDLRVFCGLTEIYAESWEEPDLDDPVAVPRYTGTCFPVPSYYTNPMKRIPGCVVPGLTNHASVFEPTAVTFPPFGPPATAPSAITGNADDAGDGNTVLMLTLNGYLAADKCQQLGQVASKPCTVDLAYAGWCRAENVGGLTVEPIECLALFAAGAEEWAGE